MNKDLDVFLSDIKKQYISKQQQENQTNAIADEVKDILYRIGENPERPGLQETPKRVAKMYGEIFRNVNKSDIDIANELLKTFGAEDPGEQFGNMVIVKGINFYSMCEHHLVPFFGTANIGYIPNETDSKVIGISKLARLVEEISKRPQIQERITQTVLNLLVEMLSPKGVMVVLKARHLCMEMRGVKKPGTETVTSAVWGVFKEDASARNEFLQLIK